MTKKYDEIDGQVVAHSFSQYVARCIGSVTLVVLASWLISVVCMVMIVWYVITVTGLRFL